MYQVPLPKEFVEMEEAAAVELIFRHKRQLGDRMVFLGHHYQRDEVIQFADYTGDSLKLSQLAAEQEQTDYIIFCGVHFMAESADILTSDKQKVLLPDLTAGCSMSDMADIDQVEEAWETIVEQLGDGVKVVPVTYVNCSAAIKAFCGRHGGVCCTSSNCESIFNWVWGADPRAVVFFMPDEHLGRNTAHGMGIELSKMTVYDPYEPNGGINEEGYQQSRLILWRGFCSVHGEFTLDHIQKARAADPDVNVIVHPECTFDVVQAADDSGSTSKIVKIIRAAQPETSWVVGTEINLINRLAKEMKEHGVRVRSLSGKACPCATMYRIDLPHLAWMIDLVVQHSEGPADAVLQNQIIVEPQTKRLARIALDKMMEISLKAEQAIA